MFPKPSHTNFGTMTLKYGLFLTKDLQCPTRQVLHYREKAKTLNGLRLDWEKRLFDFIRRKIP